MGETSWQWTRQECSKCFKSANKVAFRSLVSFIILLLFFGGFQEIFLMVLPKEFERLMMCFSYILGIELAVLGRGYQADQFIKQCGGEIVN